MRRALLLLPLVACRPDFGDRDSLVVETEVVAVRGDPPEARPGETVTYSLLVVSPRGVVDAPMASWAFCATPKLLTENGAVSSACLRDGVRAIGTGATASAAIPADACQLFGPETTSAELRPRDPDPTGGFYQPVRATVEGRLAFGQERLRCNLTSIAAEQAKELDRRYVPNRNPEIAALDAPATIAAGARATLRLTWPDASTETYAYYDPTLARVVDRRETMRVSWFTTAGSFEHDRTGRTSDERETSTENAWTAPDRPGTVHLVAVLRDDRGGVVFTTRTVEVR